MWIGERSSAHIPDHNILLTAALFGTWYLGGSILPVLIERSGRLRRCVACVHIKIYLSGLNDGVNVFKQIGFDRAFTKRGSGMVLKFPHAVIAGVAVNAPFSGSLSVADRRICIRRSDR